jgi:hypothetical protein
MHYTVLTGMNKELESTWNEAVTAQFQVLSQNLSRVTDPIYVINNNNLNYIQIQTHSVATLQHIKSL